MNPSPGARTKFVNRRGGGGHLPLPNTRRRNKPSKPHNNSKPLRNNTLSITQMNLKKKRNAWGTLLTNIHGRRNPIILASEPYTNDKNQIPHVHKDLTPYYRKKGTSNPRAAILIHKTLDNKCCELTQFTTPDLVALKIKHDSKEIIMASSYMDGNTMIPPPNTNRLIDYADKHKLPLIIGSDTNAQHKLWGNKECNKRGEELLEFLTTCGLSWANKGTTPTFLNSIIDITITNTAGCDLINDWHVSKSFSNSDHRYVMFDITSSKKTTPKQIRFTRNTDWELFRQHLESKMNQYTDQDINLTTTIHLDQACQDLTDHIMSAFELACPITYISNTIRKPPWLTPEIEAAQRSIKHKLMRARSNKTDTCWQDLRDSNKSYNKLLNNTRQREWRSFCENTESIKESARMNKILKSCSNKKEKLEAVYKTDDTLTNNATETLEVMLETHFKDDPASTNNAPHTHVLPPKTLVDKIYDPKRLDEAVNSFDPDKAAGPDSIKPIILQKSWNLIKSFTRSIMMRSHELQHIPSPWTESKGIFLPKPGKIDYNQPKSFRTITLSPVLLKLQERVILWHMQHDHNMTDSLSKKQFGFKRGTSTETALHKIAHTIERRIAKKGYVLGTFLDIGGAFDNVSFKAISDAINSSPVDKSTAGWIINMVKYRHLTVTHKDITKRIRIRRGCPQGGILSPFLWNLVVDDLLKFSAKEIPGYIQATAALMQCKRAVGPMWGLSPKTCKWIYTTVVRPILSYSATVWVRTLDNKNNLKKLERVQALALRIMTGAFPSTPFNSLNHLTETPHIGCYLKGEAAKGAARLQGYNDWTVETAPSVKGTIKSHSQLTTIS